MGFCFPSLTPLPPPDSCSFQDRSPFCTILPRRLISPLPLIQRYEHELFSFFFDTPRAFTVLSGAYHFARAVRQDT